MSARKPHVSVEQWEFGAYVSAREEASLPEVAAALEVSEATARRNLDGLVYQGLLERERGRPGRPARYRVPSGGA
jgi:predicted ArsR family transcriptional regulator